MSLGFGQILIITLLIFVIFGAGKLPSVMSDLAKGLRAFKKGMAEDENQPHVLPHKTEDRSLSAPQTSMTEPPSIIDPVQKS